MFEFLFGKPNPTREWRPNLARPLTFDLDAGALNGVALGESLERLSFLGPDEGGTSFRDGNFCYYSLGLCVNCDVSDNKITSFNVIVSDPIEPQYQPFSGRVVRKGQTIDLAALTPENCVEEFGEYYWLDRDEEESIVFYEFAGCEWQIEFNHSSLFMSLFVTDDPLMADGEQREACKVTNPWPPATCSPRDE